MESGVAWISETVFARGRKGKTWIWARRSTRGRPCRDGRGNRIVLARESNWAAFKRPSYPGLRCPPARPPAAEPRMAGFNSRRDVAGN